MFSFKAYFWNNDVYINGQYKYAANEILTAYLNTNYLSKAKDYVYESKKLWRKSLISTNMDYSQMLKDATIGSTTLSTSNTENDIDAKEPETGLVPGSFYIVFEHAIQKISFSVFYQSGLTWIKNCTI